MRSIFGVFESSWQLFSSEAGKILFFV